MFIFHILGEYSMEQLAPAPPSVRAGLQSSVFLNQILQASCCRLGGSQGASILRISYFFIQICTNVLDFMDSIAWGAQVSNLKLWIPPSTKVGLHVATLSYAASKPFSGST